MTSSQNGAATATVELLTAEVRVLMVGARQITASVAKQLDRVALAEMEPMGRIRLPGEERLVIGRRIEDGVLVVAVFDDPTYPREVTPGGFDSPLSICAGHPDVLDVRGHRDERRVFHRAGYCYIWLAAGDWRRCEERHWQEYNGRHCAEPWRLDEGQEEIIAEMVRAAGKDRERNAAAAGLPLIVLAGLR